MTDRNDVAKRAGERIDWLLYKKHINRQEFAKQLGISRTTLYSYCRNGFNDLNALYLAATILKCDFGKLVA